MRLRREAYLGFEVVIARRLNALVSASSKREQLLFKWFSADAFSTGYRFCFALMVGCCRIDGQCKGISSTFAGGSCIAP